MCQRKVLSQGVDLQRVEFNLLIFISFLFSSFSMGANKKSLYSNVLYYVCREIDGRVLIFSLYSRGDFWYISLVLERFELICPDSV